MNTNHTVRLRIAPSPTGYPHIGTIYQALFNYAFAKKHNGTFIVRIEDTDRARFVEGAEDVIFASLDWFGLPEDESPRKDGKYGPYRQSERLDLYHRYAEELIAKGHAYYSYFPKKDAGVKKDCTAGRTEQSTNNPAENPPKTIQEMMERGDWVVRMKVPKEGEITVRDEIRGEITFPVKEVTEQVLIKSDGYPTYHLAVVVDDHLMEISHIVRAEEWLSSTPKHVLLYSYFGWPMPPVFHTATLRNPDKSKLSKRQGHTNVIWYKDEGYLPEAIINYLGLLGWTHPDEKEIFSLSEFIKLFDLKDVRPIAPIFDLTKLTWMNQQYIQQMDQEELKKRIKQQLPEFSTLPDVLFTQLVSLAHTRMDVLNDFKKLAGHFLTPPGKTGIVKDHTELDVVRMLIEKLQAVDAWDKDTLFAVCKEVMTTYKVRMPLFYRLITGEERGLPLPESMVLLGKEEVLRRLRELK